MKAALFASGVLLLALLSQAELKPSQTLTKKHPHPSLQKLAIISALASRAGGKQQLGDIWNSSCSKPDDKLKIINVTVNPDPPKKGDDLTVQANFALMENVTGGTVKLQIKVDGVEIVNQDMDLCDALSQVTLMCPLGPGNHTAAITTTLPNDVPDGTISGTQYVMDQDGKELVCVDLKLKI